MSSAFSRNLYMDQGADYTLNLVLEGANGLPVDNITECYFYAKPNFNSERVINLHSSFAQSTVSIRASAEETLGFVSGRYYYTVEYKLDDGHIVRLLEGILSVKETMNKNPRIDNGIILGGDDNG